MELAVYIETIVRDFPRYHKYAIGSDLRRLSKDLVNRIVKVNSIRDKTAQLVELRDKSEELKTMIVICKEIKAFKSFRQFEATSKMAVNICRQSEGRLRSQSGKRPESGRK